MATRRPLQLDPVETSLRDGTPVRVRRIRPDDKELLVEGFRRLSDESRYRRFMAPVNELSDDKLVYLTELAFVGHFAWVAVRADRAGEGLGVARYVRIDGEPEVAEAAITVIDDYQGRGLGVLLLGLLAAAAWSAGITTFRAFVLEENEPMRDLLAQFGARVAYDSPGVVRIDVPLDPALLPDSPAARVLKASAAHVLETRARIPM